MTTLLNEAFILLLAVSLGAGVLGLAALLLTPAMRGLGARSRYVLWILLFVALLVPLRPSLGVSLVHIGLPSGETALPEPKTGPTAAAATTAQAGMAQAAADAATINTSSTGAQPGAGSALIRPNTTFADAQAWLGGVLDGALQQTTRWLGILWLVGVLMLGGYHLWRHMRFVRTVRRWCEPASDRELIALYDSLVQEMGMRRAPTLALCAGVRSPLLYGFLTPTILLPTHAIPHDELALILRHELIHFQRGDLWWRALILLATVLHWFNPAVYPMAQAAAAECEISCDERLLRGMDGRERRRYGEAILGVVGQGGIPHSALTTTFYGGKQGMKTRIEAIMDTSTKRTGIAVVLVMALAILSTGALFAAEPAPVAPVAPTIEAASDAAPTTILRVEDGVLQVSTDGGESWETAPDDLDLSAAIPLTTGTQTFYLTSPVTGVLTATQAISIQMAPASAAGAAPVMITGSATSSAAEATAVQPALAVPATTVTRPVVGGAVTLLPAFSVATTTQPSSGSVAVMAVPAQVSATTTFSATTAPLPVVGAEHLVIVTSAMARDAEGSTAAVVGDTDFVPAAPVIIVARDEELDPANTVVIDAMPAVASLAIVREGMEAVPALPAAAALPAVPATPPIAIFTEATSAVPLAPPLAIVSGSAGVTATTGTAAFAAVGAPSFALTLADYEAVGIVTDDTGALTFGGLPVHLLIDATPQGTLSIASGAAEGIALQIVRNAEGDVVGVQLVE